MRSFGVSSRTGRGGNEPEPLDPMKPVLDVAPLNSFPYIGPPASHSNPNSAATESKNEGTRTEGLAVIYFSPNAPREEWDNLVAVTKSGVAVTGSAAMGRMGLPVGRINIAENDETYWFRVSLPGVSRDEKEFNCDVKNDGRISINGITTTGEKTVVKHSQVFKMLTQNLCPPGHFSISFQLPGPVDPQLVSGSFADGILEGIVRKRPLQAKPQLSETDSGL